MSEVTLRVDQRARMLEYLETPSGIGNLTVRQVFVVYRRVEQQLRREWAWYPFKGLLPSCGGR